MSAADDQWWDAVEWWRQRDPWERGFWGGEHGTAIERAGQATRAAVELAGGEEEG